MRVLLASMPFSTLHYPGIGISLLKPALERAGVACDIRYFFLNFVDRIGIGAYDQITDPQHYQSLVGEWIFADAGNGDDNADQSLEYLQNVFRRQYPELYSVDRLITFLAARADANNFISTCLDEIDCFYDLIGFTTSFQQTLSSLALARQLKQRRPNTTIVFGGANCRGEMGLELLRRYSFLDAVCLDEGDQTFPEYVGRLAAGLPVNGIAGMAVRQHGVIMEPWALSAPVADLDALPDPDFSDFYRQHAQSAAAAQGSPAVLIETARGCWWGAKHHCTFCGINGISMAFRSKSQDRAYDEISRLADRYGTDFVSVDAILDHQYFSGLLPRLAADGPLITMYVEAKSNLRPHQIALLSQAGAKKVQPGIEALDSDVLALMRKGCTMLQNVQTLKIAAECGVYIEWNLLHGFPGESRESYQRTAELIPHLIHLQPPNAVGRVRADRFSPYFERPQEFGIRIDPLPGYQYIFPFDDDGVRGLAYHFLIHPEHKADTDEYDEPASPALSEILLWKQFHTASALTVEEIGSGLLVRDERWGSPCREWPLQGCTAEVYRACWQIISRRAIGTALSTAYDETEIERSLAALVAASLVLTEKGNYLALALRQPGHRRAPSWSEIRCGDTVPFMLKAATST